MPSRKTRRSSPCQGWSEQTCVHTRGCTYVRGTKRRYCRSKPGAHNRPKTPRSPRAQRWSRVVSELRGRTKAGEAKPSPSPLRRTAPKPRTRKRPRGKKRGERERLLRLQGQIIAELKEVAALSRRMRAQTADRKTFISERETAS